MLVACGGGGGSGGSVGSTESTDNTASMDDTDTDSPDDTPPSLSDIVAGIDWAVDAASARQAVTGSTAPTQTAAQAAQDLIAISSNANGLLLGDMIVFVDSSEAVHVPVVCSGTICSASFEGETFTDELESDENFGYDAAEIQPVMVHNGISIGQIRGTNDRGTADQDEGLFYGGWMEYSAFAVEFFYDPTVVGQEFVVGGGYAFGDSAGSNNPANLPDRTGTWTGAVVGMDYSVGQYRNHVIHGTATIDMDFVSSDLDVSFSDLVDLDDANRSIPDIGWSDLAVSTGAFSYGSGSNQIRGQFYGPDEDEVSGVFNRNQISGAFGAIRGTR